VRPATYESASEAEILKTYFRGRASELENTTFTLLDPDGEQISRGGRSPSFVFQDAEDMAERMDEFSFVYEPTVHFKSRALPTVKDLRLGVNVAACDSLPLVVGVAKKDADVKRLRKELAEFAWSTGIPGRAHYVIVEDTKGLEDFDDFKKGGDLYVLQPDTYGRDAKVLGIAKVRDKDLVKTLTKALDAHSVPKKGDHREHVGRGRREGIDWESEIPVTDPGKR
tara:strand:- start:12680 stop:13354 length:675 start_codon:yes stop_codon:yes gene_type:complete